jgi:hypothetical protein
MIIKNQIIVINSEHIDFLKINIRGNLPNSPRTAELVDRRPTSNKYLQSLVCIFSVSGVYL